MLTADGCRRRRQRLWQLLNPLPDSDYLLLGDAIHLNYLANYWDDPISLGELVCAQDERIRGVDRHRGDTNAAIGEFVNW